ncbi:MAG: PAS domain-containing protein [Leptolyngbyaceae cyanobacterium SM1_1_3]|nr:PAS domain-containing protein [Leptolyngbyaceae cyanobacterium SM1_1_3]NJM85752.1 PAS domain-containing protein [Leptolyngbyaceae cyanobacterium RM2_2_21]NJN04668.1 PAS domain-containing protein [Leptolyngbyaceae cyanobacterium RM1_1_2]NJO09215.1 PAS domain-containing protein [Leptolyngbyaceae cyanobacterium SL_1_1]
MRLLWFSLGLGLGLVLLVWYRAWSGARLKQWLQKIKAEAEPNNLSYAAQLSSAIAEQRRTISQLKQQLSSCQQVLQGAPVGYLLVDEENQLLWYNLQAANLLGLEPLSSKDLQPRLLLEVVRSYELDQLIEETRQNQQPACQDWILYSAPADPFNLSERPACPLRGSALPLKKGQIGVFLENRQEAVRLTQQRDRWMSDVAHELKTPLTSIRLVAETLKVRVEASLQGWLDRLLNETIRLSNLVEDLLNLSRLEGAHSAGLNSKPVDLAQLIFGAWQSLEPLARIKHLQITYFGPKKLLIELDESFMYRVLVNLLDNAIKYSPPRQHIQASLSVYAPDAKAASGYVLLEIIDAGPGFVEHDLPHVFERFYRADPARTRTQKPQMTPNTAVTKKEVGSGTGLGLAIVRQIIEAHQGQAEASNHPDTGGGWLKIYLPYRLLITSVSAAQ